jgi:hypothetical protein
MRECAEIMLGEAVQHLKGETSLETIYFVLFDSSAHSTFRQTWKRLLKELSAGAASA